MSYQQENSIINQLATVFDVDRAELEKQSDLYSYIAEVKGISRKKVKHQCYVFMYSTPKHFLK